MADIEQLKEGRNFVSKFTLHSTEKQFGTNWSIE
jgi:hypothetical protein